MPVSNAQKVPAEQIPSSFFVKGRGCKYQPSQTQRCWRLCRTVVCFTIGAGVATVLGAASVFNCRRISDLEFDHTSSFPSGGYNQQFPKPCSKAKAHSCTDANFNKQYFAVVGDFQRTAFQECLLGRYWVVECFVQQLRYDPHTWHLSREVNDEETSALVEAMAASARSSTTTKDETTSQEESQSQNSLAFVTMLGDLVFNGKVCSALVAWFLFSYSHTRARTRKVAPAPNLKANTYHSNTVVHTTARLLV